MSKGSVPCINKPSDKQRTIFVFGHILEAPSEVQRTIEVLDQVQGLSALYAHHLRNKEHYSLYTSLWFLAIYTT